MSGAQLIINIHLQLSGSQIKLPLDLMAFPACLSGCTVIYLVHFLKIKSLFKANVKSTIRSSKTSILHTVCKQMRTINRLCSSVSRTPRGILVVIFGTHKKTPTYMYYEKHFPLLRLSVNRDTANLGISSALHNNRKFLQKL